MSRIARIVVLVTALTSLFAVMSSTASAVTWTNTGSTTIHATGGPGTLSVGANSLACATSTATGTVPMDFTGTVLSVTGTITFDSCVLAGQNTYVHCGFTLTGQAFDEPGTTTGTADVTCVARLNSTNTPLCHIEGTTPGQYINPSGTNPGRVTLLTSGLGLTVTNASGSSCLLGTGAGHLSEQTLTLTSVAGSPIITRHP